MLQIYIIKIENFKDDKVNQYLHIMPDNIKSKILAFRQKEDAYRCLLGELLKYYMIKKTTGCPIEKIEITYNAYGKPVLAQNPWNLDFNISHSGKYVVGIIGERPVGIDVERIMRREQPYRISEEYAIVDKFFHPKEKNFLEKIQEDVKIYEAFYSLWTMKEAYIKALGIGMFKELSSFYVENVSEIYRLGRIRDGEMKRMLLEKKILDTDYVIAYTGEENITCINWFSDVEFRAL